MYELRKDCDMLCYYNQKLVYQAKPLPLPLLFSVPGSR